ncbi:hypothetical protein E8E12_007435 [Didymella heteroderae]|uniref:Uncharacterized protein n=1 Tax=Didymella heteroderae TaxID=1769908 RepID=A0A9P4WVG0_9PLEO|nr:hypothetical protein E8E12_007435 [Didymella heteroderae]
MASRTFTPMLRSAMRVSPRTACSVPRRFLNTETAPSLYSAHAKVVGARVGHVDGENLKVDLTMAKALGGKGDAGKTNPEELFAAGYGACFQSAMNAVAPSVNVKMPTTPEDSIVETKVHLVGSMKDLDMGLRVEMNVKVKGLSKEDLEKVVYKARQWLQQNVEDQIEVVKKNLVTREILTGELEQRLQGYATKQYRYDKNFLPIKDLENSKSGIRKLLKRQNEDIFFKKQLGAHLKGTVIKALIDQSPERLRKDITSLEQQVTRHLVLTGQMQKKEELFRKLIEEIAKAQANVNEDYRLRLKALEEQP